MTNSETGKKSKLKTGRLSNEERAQITEWKPYMSIEQMAEKLNRRQDAVRDFVETYVSAIQSDSKDQELLAKLHDKVYWKTIRNEFTEEECRHFEFYWVELVKQFNEDIEFSEEMQLVDLVRITILINRNLEERARAKKEIELLQKKLDDFTKVSGYPPYMDGERPDIAKMNDYETLSRGVKFCETSYVSRTNELNTLMTKKEAYMDELKATRKQRIEILKNAKKDFVSLIKNLMDEKNRNKEGLELALMNQAALKEKQKLSSLHIYSDGIADLPVLNAETYTQYKKDEEKVGND